MKVPSFAIQDRLLVNPAKSGLPAGAGHRALPVLAGSLAPRAPPIQPICSAAGKRHARLRSSQSYSQTSERISILASSPALNPQVCSQLFVFLHFKWECVAISLLFCSKPKLLCHFIPYIPKPYHTSASYRRLPIPHHSKDHVGHITFSL